MDTATVEGLHNTQSRDQFTGFLESLKNRQINGETEFIKQIVGNRKPSTLRNRLRRESVFTTPFSICIERARYFTQSYQKTEGELPIMRMAKAYSHYLANVTLVFDDHDLFACYPGGKLRCSQIFPELNSTYLDESDYLKGLRSLELNPVQISDSEIGELKTMADYWKGRSLDDMVKTLVPKNDSMLHDHGLIFAKNMLAGIGHFIVDIERVLKKGLRGLIDEATEKLNRLEQNPEDGQTPKKIAFYRSVIIALEGVITYAHRWADEAERKSLESQDTLRQREFRRIAEACRNIPEHPARTFFEALQCSQLLLFTHQMESCHISITPGRMDQFLYPYYRTEIDSGTTTHDAALEMLENFLLRIGQNYWTYVGQQGGGLFYPQKGNLFNITLSGKDPSGADKTNELTYMFLHAHANIALGHPSFSLRLHQDTPDELFEACARIIGTGKGQPAVMNDEVMIPALIDLGLEEEDAYNYGNIGCIEMGTPGTSIGPVSIGFINLAKCLELALHDGFCARSDTRIGPGTGDPCTFTRFDQLFEAYEKQVRFAMTCFNQSVSAIEMAHEYLRPLPYMSAMTDNSMESGLDQTNGGSKYKTAGVEGVGLAEVGDSMTAVKKLVFDEAKVPMSELIESLKINFSEKELLRTMLVTKAPKYGNDDDEADEINRRCCNVFLHEVKKHTDYWGSTYYPGIWSIELAFLWGYLVGALPNGRKAGEPMTEGISASMGNDINGPTALIKSVSKLDHRLIQNGGIFNLRFNPGMFEDGEIRHFINLVKTYNHLGGFQMQFSVVDRKTLEDAKANPENYRDLIVRVAGYSSYFIELTERVQDCIIQRTEYA